LHHSPLEVGTRFIARFAAAHQHEDDFVLVCTVANCRRITPELYAIGATYRKHIRAEAPPASQHEDPPGVESLWPRDPARPTTDEQLRIQKAILE
jgi:hypothetical protein